MKFLYAGTVSVIEFFSDYEGGFTIVSTLVSSLLLSPLDLLFANSLLKA